MIASPLGEIIILLMAIFVLSFIVLQEIMSNKSTWRFRVSGFIVKRPQNPDEKNGAAIAIGCIFIVLLLFLLFQRF